MSRPPDDPQDSLSPSFDVDLFLQNQAQEIALRREEIELKREQAYHNLDYANKSLEAQLEDRERDRTFNNKVQRDAKLFVAFIFFLLVAFLSIALFLNKDQIAIEIIKTIGLLLAGGVGGYAIGRHQGKSDDNNSK